MRFAFVFVLLTLAAAAQSLSVSQTVSDAPSVKFRLEMAQDSKFVVESCYWHIYEQGKDPRKPITVENCKPLEHTFTNGIHFVELVVNGRESNKQHLSLEQRHAVKKIEVRPRVVMETKAAVVEAVE